MTQNFGFSCLSLTQVYVPLGIEPRALYTAPYLLSYIPSLTFSFLILELSLISRAFTMSSTFYLARWRPRSSPPHGNNSTEQLLLALTLTLGYYMTYFKAKEGGVAHDLAIRLEPHICWRAALLKIAKPNKLD